MKNLTFSILIAFISLLPISVVGQTIYGPDFDPYINGYANGVGQNEDFMVFRSPLKPLSNDRPAGFTYFSINKESGKVNESLLSYKEGPFEELLDHDLSGDAVYQLSNLEGKVETYKLIKRSIETLEVEKEIEVFKAASKGEHYEFDKGRIYVDEFGVYLRIAVNGKAHKIQRYSHDLELEWEMDLSETLPIDKINDYAKGVHHDKTSGSFILAVDLSGNESYKSFNLKQKATSTVIALIILNKEGEAKTFIPQFENAIIYTNNNYYFDADKNELTGIYRIHFKEDNSNSGNFTDRSGYAYYKWNIESNELLLSEVKRYTFGDVILPKREEYLNASELKKDKSDYYVGLESPSVKRLENGTVLMIYTLYLYPNNLFMVCLNTDGTVIWSDISDKRGDVYYGADLTLINNRGLMFEERDLETGQIIRTISKEDVLGAVDEKVKGYVTYPDTYSNKMMICLKKKKGIHSYAITELGD